MPHRKAYNWLERHQHEALAGMWVVGGIALAVLIFLFVQTNRSTSKLAKENKHRIAENTILLRQEKSFRKEAIQNLATAQYVLCRVLKNSRRNCIKIAAGNIHVKSGLVTFGELKARLATIGEARVTKLLVGPPGSRGAIGKEGLQGSRGPRGYPGRNGTTKVIYVGQKRGPAGPRGPAGARGPMGPKGLQGPSGPPGPPGSGGLPPCSGTWQPSTIDFPRVGKITLLVCR